MRRHVIIMASLLVMAVALMGCGGGGTPGGSGGDVARNVEGTITLNGGTIPSRVIVRLLLNTVEQDEMTTASDGKYSFWAPVGTYTVRAVKSGFVTQAHEVTVSDVSKVVRADMMLEAEFVLTGVVKDTITNSVVSGAIVRLDTYTTTTNAQGAFRVAAQGRPIAQSFSVDARSASPQCYPFWAKTADGKIQDAQAITLSSTAPATGIGMGVILLWNTDAAPPAPP